MKIELSNLNIDAAIRECFGSDPEHVEKWHEEAPAPWENCVERTLRDIRLFFDKSFNFYRVYDQGRLLAYWGTETGNYINLLFVKPAHRNPEFMGWFWKEIEKSVPDQFYSAVYSKNLPAVEFYKNRGGKLEEFKHEDHLISAFTFKKRVGI